MISLEDNGKFQIFHKQSVKFFQACGVPGKAIISGIRNDNKYPEMYDKLPDKDGNPSTIDAYEHTKESGSTAAAFTTAGLKDFKDAIKEFQRKQDAFDINGNLKITEYLDRYICVDVLLNLDSYQPWIDACNKKVTDNFGKYRILQKLYSQGTGKSKNKALGAWLNTKQNTDSCAKFLDDVKTGEDITIANYGSNAHPGYIAISDLTGAIILNGLNSGFKSFLEKYYLDNPTGHVVDLQALLKSASLYAREQLEEVPSDQYAAALSAIATKLKCLNCDAPIEYKLHPKHGKPYRRCLPCARDFISRMNDKRATSKVDKPGPVVPKQSTAAKTLARANVASIATTPAATAGGFIPLEMSDSDED